MISLDVHLVVWKEVFHVPVVMSNPWESASY